MKAVSLCLVFVLAKAAAIAGHHLPLSWWSLIAWFWQDAAVALAFAALELALGGRRRTAWVVYAILAAYAALNIPVVRAVATPITWPMLRATGSALSDSLWYYITWQNAALFAAAAMVAGLAPLLLRRISGAPVLAGMAMIAALGPLGATRVDTRGLERNAWTALIESALPRLSSRATAGDWRATAYDRTPIADLAPFRRAMAGRNVVLISLESTAAQYLGLYGARPDVMPNLSNLARNAIVFDNAYAVYPESIKGLFSILCSTYPAFDSKAERYQSFQCPSVAAVLAAAGYRTALFHSGRFMYLGMEAVIEDRGFDTLADAGDIGGKHNSSFGVDEPSTVARILQWIDSVPEGRPFFVAYLPIAGHHPYESPDAGPFPDGDEFGRYRNALRYGDASLGTLVHGLRTRGLENKTLWIVLGDHGEAFGQHDGNYGHTFHLYEENVHVPFVIAAPEAIAQTTRARQIVSLIDTAPTVLDLVGLPRPACYQGGSMLDPVRRKALFFADYSLGLLGLRDGELKFIFELGSRRSKLFNLDHDPRETTDLSASHADQVRSYAYDLRNWSAAQKNLLAASRSR
jgi:lipoteichoic acid synthase